MQFFVAHATLQNGRLLILGRELYATRFCPAQDTKYLLIEKRAAYLR